jgi:Arc/MetJ-type ribon-helix-helix transcriptional regulator
MEQKFLRTSVQLSEHHLRRVDDHCIVKGTTRSAVLRDALNAYLEQQENPKANFERMAMTLEFTQVAIDILIRKQAPDRRDDILTTVDERMELYHAGR